MEKGVAICLGSAVNPDGSLPIKAQERIKTTVKLFEDNRIKKIIFTGGSSFRSSLKHKEALIMGEKALELGIPKEVLYYELNSKCTFGNAILTRFQHEDILSHEKIVVVTSISHKKRAKLFFSHVFPKNQGYKITCIGAKENISEDEQRRKKKYEDFCINFFKIHVLSRIAPGNMESLIRWLWYENQSYAKHLIDESPWRCYTEKAKELLGEKYANPYA